MFSRECTLEIVTITRSAFRVLEGASDLVQKQACIFYRTSQLTKQLRIHDEMYSELQRKAQHLRSNDKEKKSTSTSHNGKHRGHSKKGTLPSAKREYSTSSKQPNDKVTETKAKKATPIRKDEFSSIPSSKLQRLFHYGHLAAGVGVNTIGASLKAVSRGQMPTAKSVAFTNQNFKFVADKFREMRGAALKVGQMLSIQDESFLPKELSDLLSSLQSQGIFMPTRQLQDLMVQQFGENWRDQYFKTFQDRPFAAASISEIHKAVLKNDDVVAVKVQYPGVRESIDSDMDYILWIMKASSMLPRGTFPEKSIQNARDELKDECDFQREASNIETFRDLLRDDSNFVVPKVYRDLTTKNVLTLEYLNGVEVIRGEWDQETKNWIGTQIMKLCLREIAQFKFMQTDPNWANFLYNSQTKKIELVDFGASRRYGDDFIKNYVSCLRAAARHDRENVEKFSLKMGFLTGLESEEMINAHVDSVLILAEPFSTPKGESYDFSHQDITLRIKEKMKIMLNQRLTAPPQETYSLHRKFSGAFLLCMKLGATVPCQELFENYFTLE